MAGSSRDIFAPRPFYWPIFRVSRFYPSERKPARAHWFLDEYFSAFDDIMARHGLEKIKTIGDAYMAVGGVPGDGPAPSKDASLAALEMQATVARMKSRGDALRLPSLELRIGIHTGPVISGVAGITALLSTSGAKR